MSDFNDDEALAAEYVLGTLDVEERAVAESRRTRDAAFEGLVMEWEARLAPLAQATPPVAPPADLLPRLLARLPVEHAAAANDNILIMRRQLRVWRRVAAVSSAVAAVLAAWIVGREALPPARDQTYVAVLQHGADQPAFVVSLDIANRRMAVLPLATSAPPGKSYEVWMIGDHATPRSMGVIEAQTPLHPHLPDVAPGVLSNATYAVTLEQQGGSPTGQPTSTPLFVGKLVDLPL